jgi:hypothetical protein
LADAAAAPPEVNAPSAADARNGVVAMLVIAIRALPLTTTATPTVAQSSWRCKNFL